MSVENCTFERAMEAELVEQLSDRNGKVVEHVRDDEGDFVRRTYLPEFVNAIDGPFSNTWNNFVSMNQRAGIALVESRLVTEVSHDNPIVVTEYLGRVSAGSIKLDANKDRKVELAHNLGVLCVPYAGYLPQAQGYLPDGFVVHPQTGDIVMLDVDPYITHALSPRQTETLQGAFMRRVAMNIERWASNEDERIAMAVAFCGTSCEVLTDDSDMQLLMDFSHAHFMSNGLSSTALANMGY